MKHKKNYQDHTKEQNSSRNSQEANQEPSGIRVGRREILRFGVSAAAAASILPVLSSCNTNPAKKSEPLLLTQKQLRQNMTALFKRLQKDERLRKKFIHNPTELLEVQVLKKTISPQKASAVNRLLFSILSNAEFLQWFDDYARDNKGKEINQNRYSQDFAKAVVKYGDQNLIGSLARLSTLNISIPGLGEVVEQLVINNPTGQATITKVCTPANCECPANTTCTSKGFGFGDTVNPADVDPAFVRSIVEQLLEHAKELDEAQQLSDFETEIR